MAALEEIIEVVFREVDAGAVRLVEREDVSVRVEKVRVDHVEDVRGRERMSRVNGGEPRAPFRVVLTCGGSGLARGIYISVVGVLVREG